MKRLSIIIALVVALLSAKADARLGPAQIVQPISGSTNALSSYNGAVSITAKSSNGTDQISNVNVNGVLNLKAWGASGSIQRMNCNVTSGSSELAGCYGGDFKAGQTIRVLAAGVSPTILTPSAPTATCGTAKGGSCSGSTNTGTISSGSNVLTLGAAVTLEIGQAITVNGAGLSGANLVTTVAVKEIAGTTVILATNASTKVSAATVTIGTLTYGYKVVAIQRQPNGSLTAAGPAIMVIQAAQSPQSSLLPYVDTKVSVRPVTSATLYAWYKSVNGGPYNYYTITIGTSLTDYGDLAQVGFTCANEGVPCTAPSSATPNDVFARITAINGSTCTIAVDPLRPKYLQSSTPFPSQPAQTLAAATVLHDDTPAFQAIYHYLDRLPNPGYATIYMPPGDYNVYPADQLGWGRVFDVTGMNYVTLKGAGDSTRLHEFGDRTNAHASTFIESVNLGCCQIYTGYPIVDPAPYGAQQVTLTSAPDASHFFVGGYVQVQINAPVYPGLFYHELNQVTSITKTRSGQVVLALAYPLNKPYSASPPLPYSECRTCVGAVPHIAPLPLGAVATHITLKDFWFEGTALFLNTNTMDFLATENLYVHADAFDQDGLVRHRSIRNNTVIEESGSMIGPSLETGAFGSGDIVVTGNTYMVRGVPSMQDCEENTTNVMWANNRIVQVGTTSTGGSNTLLSAAGCYGFTFVNNDISISNSNLNSVFDLTAPATGIISGNVIHIDSIRSVRTTINPVGDSSYMAVMNNQWNVDIGTLTGSQIYGTNILAPYSSLPVTQDRSGNIAIYSWMGAATVFTVTLGKSVGNVNLGSTRHSGLAFAIDLRQNGTGGWTLPAGTGQSYWVTAGNNVDFLGNAAPVANPAANASTIIWFYDDGTTVHEISSNYGLGIRGPAAWGGVPFATLGPVINGARQYCSNCDPPANPPTKCTSSGTRTGAFADGLNGVWVCAP